VPSPSSETAAADAAADAAAAAAAAAGVAASWKPSWLASWSLMGWRLRLALRDSEDTGVVHHDRKHAHFCKICIQLYGWLQQQYVWLEIGGAASGVCRRCAYYAEVTLNWRCTEIFCISRGYANCRKELCRSQHAQCFKHTIGYMRTFAFLKQCGCPSTKDVSDGVGLAVVADERALA
jgi:hypothetical protein